MTETYRVVTACLRADVDVEASAQQLASLFKCSRSDITPMLTELGCVVKTGVSADVAAQYQRVLSNCGMRTTVEPEDPAPAYQREDTGHRASNPGCIVLSEPMLATLQPEVNDPHFWEGGGMTREAFIAQVAHVLRNGDARAAVVVDAEAGLVAAYTDELDCVMLLRFDPALVAARGWKHGTRLLSVNVYISKAFSVATDLLPGPDADTEFGDFWPNIADLLCDDENSLALAKGNIGEDEWQRAFALGRQLRNGRATRARDGRPLAALLRPPEPPAPPQPAPIQEPEEEAASVAAEPIATLAMVKALLLALGGFFLAALAGKNVGAMEFDFLFVLACFGMLAFSGLGLLNALTVHQWIRQRRE